MNQLLHFIFYTLKETKLLLHRFIVIAMIFWCGFSYGQNFEVDSVYIEADSLIYTAPASTLYVGEHTTIYIQKGTVTKNLVENIDPRQIVYIEYPTEIVNPIIENTPTLLTEVRPTTRLAEHSNAIVALEEQLQRVIFDYYPPIAQFSSLNSSKSAVTNLFEVYPKAIIPSELINELVYSTSYFYKKSYYYYITPGVAHCISTIEIRSPAALI